MRKVMVSKFETQRVDGLFKSVQTGLTKAVFHAFGSDVIESNDGNASYSAAIVEFDDGSVELAPVHTIRFIEPVKDIQWFALLMRHKPSRTDSYYKLVRVPDGQSMDLDDDAERKWLHSSLGTDFHLVEFLPATFDASMAVAVEISQPQAEIEFPRFDKGAQ